MGCGSCGGRVNAAAIEANKILYQKQQALKAAKKAADEALRNNPDVPEEEKPKPVVVGTGYFITTPKNSSNV